MELFDLLLKYMKKIFANVFNFIFLSLSNNKQEAHFQDSEESAFEGVKLKSISIQNFILENTLYQINTYLENNYEEIFLTFSIKTQSFIKLLKRVSDFNKVLKKEYNYDICNKPVLSDA